jgi:hypothetical protein
VPLGSCVDLYITALHVGQLAYKMCAWVKVRAHFLSLLSRDIFLSLSYIRTYTHAHINESGDDEDDELALLAELAAMRGPRQAEDENNQSAPGGADGDLSEGAEGRVGRDPLSASAHGQSDSEVAASSTDPSSDTPVPTDNEHL